MNIPQRLRTNLVNYINSVPQIQTTGMKDALVLSAGLDDALRSLLRYDVNSTVFCQILIDEAAKYGKLNDDRDAVIALIDAAQSQVGKDHRERGEQLKRAWKEFLSTNINVDLNEQRQYYLKDLIEDVSELKMSRISSDQTEPIMLSGVYIDVPVNAKLHLEVNDYKIVSWRVGTTFQDEGHTTFSFDVNINKGYDISSIEEIVAEAQDFIVGEGGNISPQEESRPLVLPPFWEDGLISDYFTFGTFDAAAAADRLVVTGVPGSGKSTFAHYIALYLAQKQLNSELDGLEAGKIRWPHGALTPIFIEIRRLVDWKEFPDVNSEITVEHFWKYICEDLLGPNSGFANELWEDLIHGRAMLILDGLDEAMAPVEIADGQKKRLLQMASLARQLGKRFSKSRIIFTSRPYEFESVQTDFIRHGFKIVSIAPLEVEQMASLAVNLYKSTGLSDEDAKGKTGKIIQELIPVYDYLKNRPLFLTLMVMLSLTSTDQKLPTKRGALLHQSILLLIDRWTRQRPSSEAIRHLTEDDTREIYSRLEDIAYHAQGRVVADNYQTVDLDIGELYREFSSYRTKMFEIVDYLTLQSGLFDPVKRNTYKFSHRTFQEFLAASHLVRQGDYAEIRKQLQRQPLSWREPSTLIGDLLSERDEKGLWELISALIDFEIPDSEISKPHHWYPTWLCSNLIINHKDYLLQTKQKHLSEIVVIKDRIKMLLTLPKTLMPVDRVQCGIALGYLSDDRYGVGLKNGLPEVDWCYIPAGRFQMGLTEKQVADLKNTAWAGEWGFDDEIPEGNFDVPAYYISRYPITIVQFQTFMKADDGYWNDHWWTPAGLKFREILDAPLIEDQSIPPNIPQNNLTWYDAMAFCNWLSHRLGLKVKLPSELEWEKAARGIDGRFFPWGNDYDPQYCNVADTKIKHPSPVGCFSFPNGPYGEQTPLDMCGNVWEWCTTVFQKDKETPFPNPYDPDDGREILEYGDDYLRIVRGGSYTNIPYLARLTARGRDKPSLKHTRQGFRIVKYEG